VTVNIIIVDDEHVIRSLLTDLLGDNGYEVTAVTNGKEAEDLFKEKSFRIAFLDVHMPVMNGVETLKMIRRVSPDTTVVMMDSFPDKLLNEAIDHGAITCIHKPFDIKEVTDIVERILKVK